MDNLYKEKLPDDFAQLWYMPESKYYADTYPESSGQGERICTAVGIMATNMPHNLQK